MKIKYLLVAIFAFLFINPDVYAYNDNYLKQYKEEAKKVEIKYSIDDEFVDENGNKVNGMFKLEISGLSENLSVKIMGSSNEFTQKDSVDGIITITGINSDTKPLGIYYYKYDVLVRTVYLNIPKYNYYSEREECQNISGEELDVCDKWYPYTIDENTFLSKINKYNQLINSEQINKTDDREIPEFIQNIIEFIQKYTFHIIIGGLVIILIPIIIVVQKKRYSLE